MKHVDPIKNLDAQTLKAAAPAPNSASSTFAIPLTGESQLFADDHLIAHKEALFRRLNRPVRHSEPILVSERPWEGGGLVYGSVVEEARDYRFYYITSFRRALNDQEHKKKYGYGKYLVCLATSTDGVRFKKPVGPGSIYPKTNVLIDEPIDDFCVRKDPLATNPAERYKLLASRGNWWGGLTPAVSADGLAWHWKQPQAVSFFGDRCSYWFDPIRKKHVAWSRNYQVEGSRVIYHKETADFSDWTIKPSGVEVDGARYRGDFPRRVLAADRYDHEQTQFYGGYAFWYRSLYFAYIEVYYLHQQRIDTQLACSRDGLTWTRLCDREVFLPNGAHGNFDAYWVVPTFNPPISRDGKLLIHYGGRPDPHAQPGFTHIGPGMGGAFGVATLREDGFVSLDATGNAGVLETKLLELPAKRTRLELNICPFSEDATRDSLWGEVEVLAPDGSVLQKDDLPAPTKPGSVWRSIPLRNPTVDKVRLRLRLKNARLYSFRIR